MSLFRVNGFLPSNLACLLALLPFLALLLVILSLPQYTTLDEEDGLETRMRALEVSMSQLRQVDETKRRALLELKAQMGVLAQLTERSNLSLLQMVSRGNNTVHKMLLYNLTHAANHAPIQLPKIFDFLPHLLYHNLSVLQPALKLSKSRTGLDLVIGIPTVKRPKVSYLMNTLHSLLENLEAGERSKVVVVVMVAEPGLSAFAAETVARLKSEFPAELAEGLLEVMVPPAAYYPPDLDSLLPTFGDASQRMSWRTKQNLDYAYLMMYCQSKGRLYLQLEDDVITKPQFFAKMMDFVAKKSRFAHWLLLEFSTLGFIGKMFRSSDLSLVVNFILMFHREKPVDWLLDHILYVRHCNPEKSVADCNTEKGKFRLRHKPSLFQHVGKFSSLEGKVQKLREKDFGKQQLHRPHADNPPARLSTSLKVYQKYTLDKAYAGDSFFWALAPEAGDWLRVDLAPPLVLAGVRLRSGNSEHPDDLFLNSSVEVRPQGTAVVPSPVATPDGWLVLGTFGPSGLVDLSNISLPWPVESLRVTVHRASSNWVILSEIWIRPAS